ncbi:MAG: lipopolysaccharide kinase InaA family protein [Planctomycetota bacterium]
MRGIPELPTGFTLVEGERGVLACRPAEREALAAAGFSPDGTRRGASAEHLPDARESGREPLGMLEVDGVSCLARRFTHGGLARALTGARFSDPGRPFAELALSERLRTLGIATPRVVAARAVSVKPFGFELTLVTERVDGVRDMGWILGEVRSGRRSRAELRDALIACGRLIGALHRVGFLHADLQPANLLVRSAVDGGAAEAIAIDLDRSRFVWGEGAEAQPLPAQLARKNLGRLWRHVRRRETEYGAVLSRVDRARFLRAYLRTQGTKPADMAELSRAIDEAASRGGVGHRIGWWLERLFGRGNDRRASAQSEN